MKKKFTNILKAVLTRLVVIGHFLLLYWSFFLYTDEVIISAWMLIGGMLICLEGLYTILMRQGQDWKWYVLNLGFNKFWNFKNHFDLNLNLRGSPMIFIYIITAFLPSLIYFHINDFNKDAYECFELFKSSKVNIFFKNSNFKV